MSRRDREEEPKGPPLTDLRGITHDSKRVRTSVRIAFNPWDNARHEWLLLGATSIRHASDRHDGRFRLEARIDATDYDHSPGYAVRLPLIGLQFDGLVVHHSRTHLIAWVDPSDTDDFHVPGPGYNPARHPEAVPCKDKQCLKNDPKGHILLPPGLYVPPFDRELFEMVRGRKVEISIGPVLKEGG